MKYLLIALVALTAAGIYLSFSETQDQQVFREFTEWQAKMGKTSNSAEENMYRLSVFTNNFNFVKQFNAEQDGSLRLGMNRFADLTNEEYGQQYVSGGLHEYGTEAHNQEQSGEVNTTVNWQQKGAVTPPADQGSCGSCWAFSTMESLESLSQIKGNTLETFSAQQLTDCSTASFGCGGGYQISTYTYTQQNGIQTAASYPYVSGSTGRATACTFNAADVVFKNTGSAMVSPRQNEQAILQALNVQPVSVLVAASSIPFQLYSSGILNNDACGVRTDHAILAYGYDNSGSTPYYMVKNSWGTTWGERGYGQIAMTGNGAGMCGIQTSVAYPTYNN